MVIEEDFINAFLHLTDTESTFADHMRLDSYFRRQAARHASKAMSVGLMQLVRSTMDLVFGFVDQECKNWVEAATGRDPMSVPLPRCGCQGVRSASVSLHVTLFPGETADYRQNGGWDHSSDRESSDGSGTRADFNLLLSAIRATA